MTVSRRTILAGVAGVGLLGAAAYVLRSKPAPPNAPLWASYKARFFKPEGRIADSGNGGISHSESQGYGMIFATAHNDRKTFDALWAWTQKTLKRSDGLFSWKYVPSADTPDARIPDRNNASDGDLLMCWALLRAARQWNDPTYTEAALRIADAMQRHVIVRDNEQTYLLPGVDGFKSDTSRVVNLSYWVFPALHALQEHTGDTVWQSLIMTGRSLIGSAQFGMHRLPTDWLETMGELRPADKFPPRFGYDAIRVPLNLAWGNAPTAFLQPFADFWTRLPKTDAYPAWVDVTTEAQSTERQSRGMRAVADLTFKRVGKPAQDLPTDLLPSDDYYAASLILQADLAAKEQLVA